MNISGTLDKSLRHLLIEADDQQKKQLLNLLDELVKWNKTYNLTAIKDESEGLVLHLLDSLAVLPFIHQKSILDVGTGAGFPGLPLAIMLPNTQFTLLDSNSKKIRFIRQQIYNLKLNNVSVVQKRVEEFQNEKFDGIISRAFASMSDMVEITRHLLIEDGRWLAMKGKLSQQEQDDLADDIKVLAKHDLLVPGLSADRCLLEMRLA